jgi:aminodeoxyfutalosine deaminase
MTPHRDAASWHVRSADAARTAAPARDGVRARHGRGLTPATARTDTRDYAGAVPFPKIELHVHLEGTVRPETLLQIARRNDYALPCSTVEELRALYEFRDFAHFIEVWILTTNALRTSEDFRQVVVDYAAEAAGHGAVYIEGIFSPAERVRRGVGWDEIFSGYCDGADEARERFGVEVRLTPDIVRGFPLDEAAEVVRQAARYRDRGVVGIGLGGLEAEFPPEPYQPVFALARDEGFASVPHAGEVAGAASVRGALDALGADRIRHGIRSVEDPGLVRELAERQLVLDVCPISNLRTRAVASLEEHPLPQLIAAGVPCSISTDDPAMFDTDLTRDYDAARSLGVEPRASYDAGLLGALCDEQTKSRLRGIGEATDWAATTATLVTMRTDDAHGTG